MNGKILPENETVEFEDRLYINPNTSLQEQTDFIQNLRNTQNANNAEINAQTYNLGTAVPSNLGGLIGGEGYFASRYQVPQSVNLAANLKTAAQYTALMESLQNQTNAWKQKYSNAYKAAQRRANTPSPSGGGGDGRLPIDDGDDSIYGEYKDSTNKGPGYLDVDDSGTFYISADGKKRYNVRDWDANGQDMFANIMTPLNKAQRNTGDIVKGSNGIDYLYISNAQTGDVGLYYPIVSTEDL